MSQILTLKLNDKVFAAIQQQAEAMGISPELLAANLLERQSDRVSNQIMDEVEKEIAPRKKFESHFGEISLSDEIDVDNDSIDADLAMEYSSNYEGFY